MHMVLNARSKEMNMRNPLGWLFFLITEYLDRSLITVPDMDLPLPATAGSATATALSTARVGSPKLWALIGADA
jgi:hypothetical protein